MFLRYGRTERVENQQPIATFKDVGVKMRLRSSSVRLMVNDHLRLIENGEDPTCSMTEREINIEANKTK